jgi:hypothetical protein
MHLEWTWIINAHSDCSYHKHRGNDWLTPSKMTRLQLISYLQAHQIDTITLNTDNVQTTITVPPINSKGSKTTAIATVSQLQTAVKQHLTNNAQQNQTEIENELSKHQYRIIYTPPFTPEAQPIEMLWGTVKRQVAEKATINRTVDETRQQVRHAFQAVTVTNEACNSLVEHCHKGIDDFIQTDEAESLKQYGSLQKLIQTDVNTTQSTAADAQ